MKLKARPTRRSPSKAPSAMPLFFCTVIIKLAGTTSRQSGICQTTRWSSSAARYSSQVWIKRRATDDEGLVLILFPVFFALFLVFGFFAFQDFLLVFLP